MHPWPSLFIFLAFAGGPSAFASPACDRLEALRTELKSLAIPPNIRLKIESNSAQLLGKPYGGGIGEGPLGIVNSRPIVCTHQYDCVTFVESVMAKSISTEPANVLKNLVAIRYKDGKISYVRRNHFTELDWIPANTANGVFVDITQSVARGQTRAARAQIDRGAWMQRPGHVQRDLPEEAKKQIADRLAASGRSMPPAKVSIRYVPKQALLEDPKIRARIPSGSVFSVVRDSVDWVVKGGKRQHVGSIVSHQGFIIRKDNKLYVRHASSLKAQIVDEPLEAYLRQYEGRTDILGLNILKPTGHAPVKGR